MQQLRLWRTWGLDIVVVKCLLVFRVPKSPCGLGCDGSISKAIWAQGQNGFTSKSTSGIRFLLVKLLVSYDFTSKFTSKKGRNLLVEYVFYL